MLRVILVAVLLLLAGPVAAAESVLHVRLNSDILSSEPGTLRDGNTDQVLLHVTEGLVAYRENGTVAPLLAQGWTISPDGKTYTFALRAGIHFHNGQPMTSADAVWSLKRWFGMGARWRCGDSIGPKGMTSVVDVTAPDASTVVIRLDRPAPLFLTTLARTDCGGTPIVSPASADAGGKWIAPIGTGPFMFGAWKRNQSIDLVKFAGYSALPGPRDGNTGGKTPLVDRVHFLIIPDSSAAVGALLRGNLDVLGEVAYVDYDTVRHNPDVTVNVTPMMDINTILIQTRNPKLADPRLRQAIALTIDTEGMARVITRGTARGNNSPVPRTSPFYGAAEAKLRGVDIVRAKQLAAAAGYRGEPIHLMTNHRYPELFDQAVLLQAMAHKAGINIVIDTVDWATEVSKYSVGDYELVSFSFGARLDPAFNFQLFIGDRVHEPRKVWNSPQAKAMLDTISATADPKARQAQIDTLQAMFMDETPAIVTFNTSRLSAVRKNVVGYACWPTGLPRYWGVSLK